MEQKPIALSTGEAMSYCLTGVMLVKNILLKTTCRLMKQEVIGWPSGETRAYQKKAFLVVIFP